MSEQTASTLANLLSVIRSHEGLTRADMVELTGLSRQTVTARLGDLLAQGLVAELEAAPSTGGRPPARFAFDPGGGIVLGVDAGVSRTGLAVADGTGELIANRLEPRPINADPRVTLSWIYRGLDELLAECGRTPADVRAIGVGLPGTVDHVHGRPLSPDSMPGWDGFPVADAFRERYGVDVLVDNDVNVIALGEAEPDEVVAVVKAGSGIGLGYVTDGVVQRGAQGVAGEIAHVNVPGYDDVACRCGKTGCLEAVAGGTAMAERLTAQGIECGGTAELASLARAGVPEAIAMVREAGRAIGFVLATVVNILNPARLVIAGDLTEARDYLLSALRETVYREAAPLATAELEIARARAGTRAGLKGTVTMALGHALQPAALVARAAG